MSERSEESAAGPLLPADRVPRRSPVSRRRLTLLAATFLGGMGGVSATGQEPPRISNLALRFASMTAVTGYEQRMVDTLLRLLPGARRDRFGNVRLELGGGVGANRRVLACPLDEPGYVVGALRDDGYLTLRRVPGQVSPLFDQQLEGHRITILGGRGAVPGVVAVRSIHLTRGRQVPSAELFTVDDAYVDVGAASRAEALRLGIRVLAPTSLAKRPHSYGKGLLAAPVAGRRAACAAVLVAARQSVLRARLIPSVTVAFLVQQELSQRGLAALANTSGPFQQTLIVDGRAGLLGSIQRTSIADTTSRTLKLGQMSEWALPVRHAGTAVETVSLADADSLRSELVRWVAGDQ